MLNAESLTSLFWVPQLFHLGIPEAWSWPGSGMLKSTRLPSIFLSWSWFSRFQIPGVAPFFKMWLTASVDIYQMDFLSLITTPYSFLKKKFIYRIFLFSVKHQHGSAIGIHMSPPSWTSLPSPSPSYLSRLIQSPSLSSLRHTANSHRLSILHMVM